MIRKEWRQEIAYFAKLVKTATLVVVVAGFLGWAIFIRRPKVITAERFVLVDANGKRSAEFAITTGFGSFQNAHLTFYDKIGDKKIKLLMMGSDGKPCLTFYDKIGSAEFSINRVRAQLGVRRDGEIFLSLFDKDGKPKVSLFIKPDGKPGLVFYDKNGTPRAGLNIGSDGEPGLTFYDKNGDAGLLIRSNGEPFLGFYDKNGKPRVGLGIDSDGEGSLALYDKNGKVIWSAR